MLTETGASLLLSDYPVRHYHPYTGVDLVVETTDLEETLGRRHTC